MFRRFEHLVDHFAPTSDEQPPARLAAFYWHYARQVWPLLAAVMLVGFCAALVEVALFAFLGEIVDLVRAAETPSAFFAEHGAMLAVMAFVALILRPLVFGLHTLLVNQAIVPSLTNLVRWQTHRYVLRQSLSFFQDDFAGRIANKIMQTGPSLRESVVQTVDALWFVAIYTVSALLLFLEIDPQLILPLLLWVIAFVGALSYFVPRIKQRSFLVSEARSALTGRIVDGYTNILTVKLFAHAEREEAFAREALTEHTEVFRAEMRMITLMEFTIWVIGGALIVSTCGLALLLWSQGQITLGAIALATGLVLRINNMAGWIMWVVTGIFENLGTVQEGMETIAKPQHVTDRPAARPLAVTSGEIRYEGIRFHYGKGGGVIDDLSLTIRPGQKVGLVGRSGAGKSTLVNLLLRFHDLEAGRILIDGQDIAEVTQESLRAQIGVVTQDPSLLHRSVLENIRYGRPEASQEQVISAADQAHAHSFVQDLRDGHGHRGYAARVGERGVKLSGGQRQRVALARVLLKDAPILILDEATSALDSEVEAAVQEQLAHLMTGKTVIAIAHRLSTIAAMDRLIVMDQGRIIEDGDHASLLRHNGLYAQLWTRQSGGFLAHDKG
ncbi:ABC transporter ATP-binding protein [Algihabitans albus]|uniref:ABC transporter ATP-binding protein n=1 Tax=Algihabitans albus TaxID=2164067 RepID=UPI000E5CD48D|nr:ABC transporter ATP-binding protein [Algihabitans albus]